MKVIKHRTYAIRVEFKILWDEEEIIFDSFAFMESKKDYDEFFSDIKITIEDDEYTEETFQQLYSKEEFVKLIKYLYDYYQEYIIPETEFLQYHCTGHIDSSAYSDMNFDYDISDYPILSKKITDKKGESISFRKKDEKNKYVKKDNDGEILRDKNNMALYLSDEEVLEKGLHLYETGITAFNEAGECVAYASDEFGSDGVWVRPDYQKRGIGLALITEFRKQFKPGRQMGQMTEEGMALALAFYRSQK